jgi:hypothetical protein
MRYDWSFGPADVYSDETFTNAVSHVHWYCTFYADDGTSYKKNESIQLGTPNPDSFLPFEQLDLATVQSWVFAQIDKNQIESDLLAESNAGNSNSPVRPFNF